MDEMKKLEEVVGVRFASQEFFERLKNGLQDEKLKDWTYAELYFVLQRDTKYKIINRVGYSNWEDVFQNVVSAVIRQLSSFILNPKSLIEANRQAWLNTIVRGESASWIAKNIDWPVSLEQLYEEGELSHELIKSVRESNIEENPESIYMDREISIEFQNKLKELYSLNSSPERLISYTLRDFFLQFDEHSYMRLIEDCGESGVLNMILGNRGNGDNLQALGVFGELVTTALQTLIDVFADDGDFSIREFVRAKDKKALFINYDMAYKASQVPIYGSLVNLMLKEVLSQNNNAGKTILICDEIVTMGKTDIAQAVNLGRAKGLMVIVGLQSIEQLKSIYGEHDAIAMLAGMCNKLYFRANDPTTRNYIKEDFGKTTREYIVLSPGGCMSERREVYIIEDADFNRLGLGQCYVKNADGITYLLQID